MSISTHVLDTARGLPAAGIALKLLMFDQGSWTTLAETRTDANGRTSALLPPGRELTPGLYRLHFDTAAYFASAGVEALHPYIEITFQVREGQPHYHIPLLLTANSYTTYRGS